MLKRTVVAATCLLAALVACDSADSADSPSADNQAAPLNAVVDAPVESTVDVVSDQRTSGSSSGATGSSSSSGTASSTSSGAASSTSSSSSGTTSSSSSSSSASSSSSSSSSGTTMPSEAQRYVNAINTLRAGVSPAASPSLAPMSWSTTLESAARAESGRCIWSHTIYGVLYASTGPSTPENAVSGWASEVSNYNYAANSCSGVCGHYTALAWRTTTQVGCATTACNNPQGLPAGTWNITSCALAPSGNNGSRPY